MSYDIVNLLHHSGDLTKDQGTYLASSYEDAGRVYSFLDSLCWLYQGVLQESEDASFLLFRRLSPYVHRELFFPLFVDAAAYQNGFVVKHAYGRPGSEYGMGNFYGEGYHSLPYCIPLPENIVDVDFISDIPIDPNVILLKNVDFSIESGMLWFNLPLPEEFQPLDAIGRDNIVLYLCGVTFDRRYIQNRLGRLLNIVGDSTQEYKSLCNMVMDTLQSETTRSRFKKVLALLSSLPCVSESEKIEMISPDWIATDKHVYLAGEGDWLDLTVGRQLNPGDFLTNNVVDLIDYHQKIIKPVATKHYPVVLPRPFLGEGYLSSLTFPDEWLSLEIDTKSGQSRFPVFGVPADVDLFWEKFYGAMEIQGKTSSDLYSLCPGGKVNPAEFVVKYLLTKNVLLFWVSSCTLIKNTSNWVWLRRLLPPSVFCHISVQVPEITCELNLSRIRFHFSDCPIFEINGAIPLFRYEVSTKPVNC
jgi:hypothetical protein